MMDAHTLSLLLAPDTSSAQGSADGEGIPPGTGRWDAADFSTDFVRIFRDSGTPSF